MDKKDFQERTKRFALRVIRLVQALPKSKARDVIGYQLLKSGTSIGVNYREAVRAVSKADFICKISIIEKESNETLYWLELLEESKIMGSEKLCDLKDECEQLLKIFTATGNTAKRK